MLFQDTEKSPGKAPIIFLKFVHAHYDSGGKNLHTPVYVVQCPAYVGMTQCVFWFCKTWILPYPGYCVYMDTKIFNALVTTFSIQQHLQTLNLHVCNKNILKACSD